MRKHFKDEAALSAYGEAVGRRLKGGEVFELVGDVGAGKTTLTKAIARGMGIGGPIQSPTFTISNRYEAPSGITMAHYDFYRLSDPGLMSDELAESIDDKLNVTIIEWADIVSGVLPDNRITIKLKPVTETERDAEIIVRGDNNPLLGEPV